MSIVSPFNNSQAEAAPCCSLTFMLSRVCALLLGQVPLMAPRIPLSAQGNRVTETPGVLVKICLVARNTQTSLNKNRTSGLPWWRSCWQSACQCRGHGFEPWSEKIPHAAEQLGPWATTTEPARLEPVLCNKRGRDSERPAHRDEEWPPLAATRESPRTETKTQHS